MRNKSKKTLIIGAGPAGLAAAIKLADAKQDFLVIEKQNQIGGLAKTYEFREGDLVFRTDNGPHRFFSKNPELYKFLGDLLQERWVEVRRQTRQFIGGKFYDYPVNPAQALSNIGGKKALMMGLDYLMAKIKYKLLRAPVKNFEDYIISNFGRGLGNFNMINYTEKIWGVPASTIHTDWAEQRIRGLSVRFLIKAALNRAHANLQTEQVRTLVDYFYYPESGTGLIYETIAKKLSGSGYGIQTNTTPIEITHHNQKIETVLIKTSAGQKIVKVDYLIESMPIEELLKIMTPSPPSEILNLSSNLKYRNQVYLFITLNKDRVTNDQWIYFPEKNIPFGRVSEMKNFSSKMSPLGKTSLLIEFFCFPNDDIWNLSKEKLSDLAVGYLEGLGFFSRKEVRSIYHFRQEKVYPIYDTNYKSYLSTIKNYLNQFENLFYIGRPGRFRYNNQDHSLEMGFAAAKSIIENRVFNLDMIGGDDEYLEKGNLR